MSEITGLWIPLEYLRNARLSRNELVIISYVKYRLEEGVFKGNHVEISQALNLKSPRVSEAIFSLFQKGFLDRSEDQKHYILSQKYLDLEGKKVTESVIITETVNITESVTKSYGKRNKKVTETVTHTYIEKDNKKENNNNVYDFENVEVLDEKKSVKKSSKKTLLPEIEFLESEFKDFGAFEEYIKQAHPDIDTSFYYHKISSWIDKNTGELAKRKIWKNTIQQFLENDYKRGDLVTTKSKSNAKQQSNNYPKQTNLFEQQATAPAMDDLVSQYFAQ